METGDIPKETNINKNFNTAAKELNDSLNDKNKEIITQELTLKKRESMSIQNQTLYVQKLKNLPKEPTIDEVGDYSKHIRRQLIEKFPPAEQWQHIKEHDLMTSSRTLETIIKDLPGFEKYLNELPVGAKIVDIGSGESQTAINEIKNIQGKKFQTYAFDKDINPEHDLNKGLTKDIPMDCDLMYSDRVLQYTKEPLKVVQDVWDRLKVGGKAVLHMGYEFSRTSEALNKLTNKNPSLNLIIIKKEIPETGFMGINIVLQKTSANDEIELPKIGSSLSNESVTYKGQEIRWSNLYYDYKLVGEKEYKREGFKNEGK